MKKLYQTLAKVLELDENEITDQMSPKTVESWDSFNGLLLVVQLENEFNVKFTMNEVAGIQNVGDIKALLRKHNILSAEGADAA